MSLNIMHVVHLEDDGPLREILKSALNAVEPNLKLKQFITGDEVMTYTEDNPDVDLFILDIRVPGSLDGIGVAQKIRDIAYTGSIVITSAFRPPSREVLNALDCEWFPKPWHIMETSRKLLEVAGTNSTYN